MIIRFIDPTTKKSWTLRTTQVVVCTDDGQPVACTYEQGKVIVHSDATQDDFSEVIDDLKIGLKAGKVEIHDSK